METASGALICWHLQHSGHQLMAIVANEIVLSKKLKRGEVDTLRRSWESADVQDADLHHRVSIHAVEQLVADTTRRHLTIVTDAEEVLVPGFESKSGRWIHQLGINDNRHDPLGPLSHVVEAANLIAQRVGLHTEADLRASIVVFEKSVFEKAVFDKAVHDVPEAASQVGEPMTVRPWRPLVQALAAATWVVGCYWLLLGPIEGFALPWYYLVAIVLTLASAVANAALRFLTGITVDSRGISGVGIFRHRRIEWPDVALVHSVLDSGDGARRGNGRGIVLHDGSKVELPGFGDGETQQLDAAVTHFANPYGIRLSIDPAEPKLLVRPIRRRIRSPIAAKVFSWDL